MFHNCFLKYFVTKEPAKFIEVLYTPSRNIDTYMSIYKVMLDEVSVQCKFREMFNLRHSSHLYKVGLN